MTSYANSFIELIDIISKLRAPDGCPWDKKQTPASLKQYLMEETHELAEAIDSEDIDNIKEELGDLFFQLGFLASLYEEYGQFTIDDTLQTIITKMIRRHPHVFTDQKFSSDEEIRQNWQKIKAEEKKKKAASDYSLDVPKTLPALNRAQRVSSRIAAHGFEWPDDATMINKLSEEHTELQEALVKGSKEEISDEIGDVMFMLINICRRNELYGEDIMHKATDKFLKRYQTMAQLVKDNNKSLTDLASNEQLFYWQEAKKILNKN